MEGLTGAEGTPLSGKDLGKSTDGSGAKSGALDVRTLLNVLSKLTPEDKAALVKVLSESSADDGHCGH